MLRPKNALSITDFFIFVIMDSKPISHFHQLSGPILVTNWGLSDHEFDGQRRVCQLISWSIV